MHQKEIRGEKPNVRRKYLSPDEARRLIEAAGNVGRQRERKAQAESDGKYVFRSERGGPLSVDAVQAIVARAGRLAGLGVRCHPHMLRHACGFFLAEEGTDTRLIQDYLGHRDIKSTVIYTETSQRWLSGVRVR